MQRRSDLGLLPWITGGNHDDVIDEADSRRGTPSANARWDNTVAILTGDFLFARAS